MARKSEEWAILALAARLAQAGDDRDIHAYRACLAEEIWTGAPDATFPIPAEDYARDAMRRLSETLWTHHLLSNPAIDIDVEGLRAAAAIDVVVIACRASGRTGTLRTVTGGRYHLGLVRDPGGWRIAWRRMVPRYTHDEASPLRPCDPLDGLTIEHGAAYAI